MVLFLFGKEKEMVLKGVVDEFVNEAEWFGLFFRDDEAEVFRNGDGPEFGGGSE